MRRIAIALLVVTALLSACRKREATPGPASEDGPFAPRQDSALTAVQVRRWTQANALLDSLSFAYRDSFQTQDPAAKAAAQKSFQTAQNSVCTQQGMRGGYEEYRYIATSLALPVNKALRDSMGMKLFP
jgi:hypothetical protein